MIAELDELRECLPDIRDMSVPQQFTHFTSFTTKGVPIMNSFERESDIMALEN